MILRAARPADKPGLMALWQQVFGDAPTAVEAFFQAFPRRHCWVAEEEGSVVAMVHGLPQELAPDVPSVYLYAVATAPDFRRQGLCRRLLQLAQNDLLAQGVRLVTLTPAEPSLFSYYETLGYTPMFTRNRTPFPGGRPISQEEYLQLREEVLRSVPHTVCSSDLLHYAAATYEMTFYQTAQGCAALSSRGAEEVLPEDLGGLPCAMGLWLGDPLPVTGVFPAFPLD